MTLLPTCHHSDFAQCTQYLTNYPSNLIPAPGMARYVPITADMNAAVLQHLRESFFADEPLNKAVQLCERGQPHAALERLCTATIADGLSVAVVEDDLVRKNTSGETNQQCGTAVAVAKNLHDHYMHAALYFSELNP